MSGTGRKIARWVAFPAAMCVLLSASASAAGVPEEGGVSRSASVVAEAPFQMPAQKSIEITTTPAGILYLTPGAAQPLDVKIGFTFRREDPRDKSRVPVRNVVLTWEDTVRSTSAKSGSAQWRSQDSGAVIEEGDTIFLTFQFKLSKQVGPNAAIHPIRITCTADGYAPQSTLLVFERSSM